MNVFGFTKNQKDLVNQLLTESIIKTNRIKEVLLSVDRGDFISRMPYTDCAQSIGYGATISAPHMHAYALESLNSFVKKNSKILDVGSGSGYLTTCFAKLLENTGKVVGVEHIQDLVDLSIKNIKKNHSDLLKSGQIKIIKGDGRFGYSEDAPYNAIHVGAAADKIPQELINQLAVGGRMVIPLGKKNSHQDFVQIDKISENNIQKKVIVPVTYVPLTTQEEQLRNM